MRSVMPENIAETCAIERLRGRQVILKDGVVVEPDLLMLCTGYEYSFPFLSATKIQAHNQHVIPLYKHIVHMHDDTLMFVGIPRIVVPFPQFNLQAQCVVAKLRGVWTLPTLGAMIEDSARDLQVRLQLGWRRRHAHVMKQLQWRYNRQMADLARCPPIPQHIENLYEFHMIYREQNLSTYKQSNYRFINGQYVFV